MEQSKKTVKVVWNGNPLTCPAGTVLGDLLQAGGHGHMPCGGHGKCGKCRVTVTGEVSPPTEDEQRTLTPDELAERLASERSGNASVSGSAKVSLPSFTRSSSSDTLISLSG